MSTDTAILATIEKRVREQVTNRLTAATSHLAAVLGSAIRTHTDITGGELLSHPDTHNAVRTILDGTAEAVDTTVRAGYQAGSRAAQLSVTRDLKAVGYSVPKEIPEQGGYLPAVLLGLAAAFGVALNELQESVRTTFDSITGPLATTARILAVHTAISRVTRRLGVRARSAATVAVHRGFTDAQAAIYRAYLADHPSAQLRKTWVVTSTNPCSACAALDGTTVDIDAEFDREATTDPKRKPPAVYRDLLGPPRHPNCRCRIDYTPAAGTVIARTVTAAAPVGRVTQLSAASVRQMPSARFTAITAFFVAAAKKLTDIARRRG